MGRKEDFDFLAGHEWRVHNRVLAQRFASSDEWNEFEATLLDFRHILAGYGNVDRFLANRDGEAYEASSIRIFDPTSEEWQIYWTDTLSYRVTPQVVSCFDGDRGEFFGEEPWNGKSAKLRFRWSDVGSSKPRWEQAYQDPGSGEWETNWHMVFEARSREDPRRCRCPTWFLCRAGDSPWARNAADRTRRLSTKCTWALSGSVGRPSPTPSTRPASQRVGWPSRQSGETRRSRPTISRSSASAGSRRAHSAPGFPRSRAPVGDCPTRPNGNAPLGAGFGVRRQRGVIRFPSTRCPLDLSRGRGPLDAGDPTASGCSTRARSSTSGARIGTTPPTTRSRRRAGRPVRMRARGVPAAAARGATACAGRLQPPAAACRRSSTTPTTGSGSSEASTRAALRARR